MDDANVAPVRVTSRTDLTDLADDPPPASPTSTDGWGELENGIHGDHETDKDGWDDIEPLEELKPSSSLANIQAAKKRPVSLPKSQGSAVLSYIPIFIKVLDSTVKYTCHWHAIN